MSLTAFQKYRRMVQVEEMKPENIRKETKVEQPVTAPVEEVKEIVPEPKTEETTTSRRRRRTTE